MPEWEHKVEIAKGQWFRGPVRARLIQRVLAREEQGGWELCGVVPVTQAGFTSAVWLFFKRPRLD
ncbi:MAG TPA: hypothetical protein VNH38_03070 [Candidatus Dormibacteraeota bacterium]|nr:hypothetical protein [Candidatus Dormibacteraeota bacterium]